MEPSSADWQRRLSAVLIADLSGYSRLMGINEVNTRLVMKIHREEVIDAEISAHKGRVVNAAGDGLLAEFQSVVSAVQCAINIQRSLCARDRDLPEDQKLCWRIGINFGDVVVEGNDIFGDSVNVAARLEALAEPGGICISERVYSEIKNKLDVNFEPLGERWLKNIAEPVRVYRSSLGLDSSGTPPIPSKRINADVVLNRPSIAVLPFANLTANQGNQYIADGLTEDLITNLSMSPEFFVIARTSSFAFQHEQNDLKAVARQLGVRYLVVGSLQHSEDSFRVSVQLLEANTGIQLWAHRYNRDNAELFEVRDDITRSIAATLMTTAGVIAKAEFRRQETIPPESYTVYDHFLRARNYFHKSLLPPWKAGKEWSELAKAEFEKGIALSDPPWSPLYSGLAWQYAIDFDWNYGDDPVESAARALENAAIAAKHDPTNHQAHWVMGWAYLFYKRDYPRATYHYEKARELNVGDCRLLAEMAQLLIYTGNLDQAIIQLKQAIRLNPFHEQWYDEFLARAYEEGGQPEKAIEILSRFDELEGIWSHATFARAYAQVGQLDRFAEQIEIIDKLVREQTGQGFSIDFWKEWVRLREPYQNKVRAERVVSIIEDALTRCGYPS